MLFRLIGHRLVFRVVDQYLAAGFIPTVVGHTLDGKWQTHARIEDVEIVPDLLFDET